MNTTGAAWCSLDDKMRLHQYNMFIFTVLWTRCSYSMLSLSLSLFSPSCCVDYSLIFFSFFDDQSLSLNICFIFLVDDLCLSIFIFCWPLSFSDSVLFFFLLTTFPLSVFYLSFSVDYSLSNFVILWPLSFCQSHSFPVCLSYLFLPLSLPLNLFFLLCLSHPFSQSFRYLYLLRTLFFSLSFTLSVDNSLSVILFLFQSRTSIMFSPFSLLSLLLFHWSLQFSLSTVVLSVFLSFLSCYFFLFLCFQFVVAKFESPSPPFWKVFVLFLLWRGFA